MQIYCLFNVDYLLWHCQDIGRNGMGWSGMEWDGVARTEWGTSLSIFVFHQVKMRLRGNVINSALRMRCRRIVIVPMHDLKCGKMK